LDVWCAIPLKYKFTQALIFVDYPHSQLDTRHEADWEGRQTLYVFGMMRMQCIMNKLV
jgi:hypothetical protein